jgi:hypothetical protein
MDTSEDQGSRSYIIRTWLLNEDAWRDENVSRIGVLKPQEGGSVVLGEDL